MTGNRGFDFMDDEVVLEAIKETNRRDTPMLDTWDRDRVWGAYASLLSMVPAFEKFRASHSELGDWIDGAEYDRGPYRLRGAAGGLVYARIGDWGNVRYATSMQQLPLQ